MGYDLHITRKALWCDNDGSAIDFDEWKNLVLGDPEMRQDGWAEALTTQGTKIRTESKGMSVWTAYSKHGQGGNMAWFDLVAGNIDVKNPDKEIRAKMYQIALKLAAKVQGDEGELYDEKGDAK